MQQIPKDLKTKMKHCGVVDQVVNDKIIHTVLEEDVEGVLIVIEAASKMKDRETITLVSGMTVQAIPTKAVISIKMDTRQRNSSQAT